MLIVASGVGSMILIEAALFLLTCGLLFNEKFRSNWLLMSVAAVISIASTVLLFEELRHRFKEPPVAMDYGRRGNDATATPASETGTTTIATPPQRSSDVVSKRPVCIFFNGREQCE